MDADPEIGAAASGDEDEDGSGMDSDHNEQMLGFRVQGD